MVENKFELERKIRLIVKHFDITMKEVSSIMGMTPQNLNRVMKVNTIDTKYLLRIAEYCNFQAGYLFKNGISIDARYTHLKADDNSFLNNATSRPFKSGLWVQEASRKIIKNDRNAAFINIL